jgi:hypothetical protein
VVNRGIRHALRFAQGRAARKCATFVSFALQINDLAVFGEFDVAAGAFGVGLQSFI